MLHVHWPSGYSNDLERDDAALPMNVMPLDGQPLCALRSITTGADDLRGAIPAKLPGLERAGCQV